MYFSNYFTKPDLIFVYFSTTGIRTTTTAIILPSSLHGLIRIRCRSKVRRRWHDHWGNKFVGRKKIGWVTEGRNLGQNSSYKTIILGYLPPNSNSYRGPAPSATYLAPTSAIPKTQPVYTNAISHDYKTPPGMLRRGYFIARSAAATGTGYNAQYAGSTAVNPAYYYSAGNQAYFGPWYQPPPTVLQPPIYIPSSPPPVAPIAPIPTQSYTPSRPTTYSPTNTKPAKLSSYSRRDGNTYDLDMAASEAVSTTYSGGYVNNFIHPYSKFHQSYHHNIFSFQVISPFTDQVTPLHHNLNTQSLVTLQHTQLDTSLPLLVIPQDTTLVTLQSLQRQYTVVLWTLDTLRLPTKFHNMDLDLESDHTEDLTTDWDSAILTLKALTSNLQSATQHYPRITSVMDLDTEQDYN